MRLMVVLGSAALATVAIPALAAGALFGVNRILDARAAREATLIRTSVVRGEARADVYRLFRANDLTPYDDRFVQGKTKPGPDPAHPFCDLADRASGAWPYRNEPLPKQPAGCEDKVPPGPVPEPEADVDLGGSVGFACGSDTYAEIKFDDHDRVTRVEVNGPQMTCL
jgi:hypothetical protein